MRVQYLETKAMHLCMFYIAFHSVLFLSVSKPSAIQCSSWWKSFSLSLLMAIVLALNFTTTTINYVRTQFYYDLNLIDQQENYDQMVMLENQTTHRAAQDVEMNIDRPGGMSVDLHWLSRGQEQQQQKSDAKVGYRTDFFSY